MAFDDLPLDRPTEPASPSPLPDPEGGSLLRWIIVGLAGVLAGGLLTFLWMSRAQPVPKAPPSTTAPDVVASPLSRPVRQPLNLPGLGDSDTFVRDLVSTLSKHPTLSRLLATSGLVRATTLGVVQIGDGRTPVEWLRVLRPTSRLQITGRETGAVTPASYERWDTIAAAVSSVSPADAAQLYVNVKPLLDEAYIELGQTGGDFDRAIVRAIQMLADTPEPATDPQLLRRPGYFEHETPTLQSLRPVQKQWLLLGPENRRQLLQWLNEFSKALELR